METIHSETAIALIFMPHIITRGRTPRSLDRLMRIGIGEVVAHSPLPHDRTCGTSQLSIMLGTQTKKGLRSAAVPSFAGCLSVKTKCALRADRFAARPSSN